MWYATKHKKTLQYADIVGFVLVLAFIVLASSGMDSSDQYMHTLEKLKGNGIGKTILQEAVNIYTEFNLPPTSDGVYYFIEDGYGWIQKRFDDKTLTEPPFIRPE